MQNVILFVVSIVVLGALSAAITNGLMEGFKNIFPDSKYFKGAYGFGVMLLVSGVSSFGVYDGSKSIIQTSFWLIYMAGVAGSQLGWDLFLKEKVVEPNINANTPKVS